MSASDDDGTQPDKPTDDAADGDNSSEKQTNHPTDSSGAVPASAGSSPVSEAAQSDPPPSQDELPEVDPLTPELVEEEALRGDFMLRWAVILLAVLMGCTQIKETVSLVHIRSGQHTLEHGWPATTGVFSSSAEDQPWANLSWLFDVVLAAVYGLGETVRIGGDVSLTIFKALLGGLIVGLVVGTTRPNVSTWWSSICATIALLLCYRHFTATPQIVTLLGLASTCWLLNKYVTDRRRGRLIGLVVVFWFWSNMDPRMFLGLTAVLLYAIGETIGSRFGRGALDAASRRRLWIAAAGCVAVTLIGPFLHKPLTAPFALYGQEYPAQRLLHQSIFGFEDLQWYSLLADNFINHITDAIAGLLMLGLALVAVALNFKDLDLGHAFLLLGFALLGALTFHELPAAALVACVLCALNAQQWYRGAFRQTYSVETSELAFSRGGRAVTVLALFLCAWLMISGRMTGANGRRVGLGFHHSISAGADGMAADLKDAYDDKPFNFVPEQGDLLIWIGKRPFIDSRIGLYAGTGEDDLVGKFRVLRSAVRDRSRPENRDVWRKAFDEHGLTHVVPRLDSRITTRGVPDAPTLRALLASPDWTATQAGSTTWVFHRTDLADEKLRRYLLDHRLDLVARAFREEHDAETSQWYRPGGTTFYDKYLSKPQDRTPNVVLEAFNYRTALEVVLRVQPRSVGQVISRNQTMFALAYLTVQRAGRGLAEDPQSAEAYIALAAGVEALWQAETSAIPRETDVATLADMRFNNAAENAQQTLASRRYYQVAHALQQYLVLKPDESRIWRNLHLVYRQNQQFGLALEALDRSIELLEARDDLTDAEAGQYKADLELQKQLAQQVSRTHEIIDALAAVGNALESDDAEEAAKRLAPVERAANHPAVANQVSVFRQHIQQGLAGQIKLAEAYPPGTSRFPVAGVALALHAVDKALELLEDIDELEAAPLIQLSAMQLRANCLLEAGRLYDAIEILEQLEPYIKQAPKSQLRVLETKWKIPMALASAGLGNHDRAVELWTELADGMEVDRKSALLESVSLSASTLPQVLTSAVPVIQRGGEFDRYVLANPHGSGMILFNAALSCLEKGDSKRAAELLQRVLDANPDTPLRALTAFYLSMIRGKPVDQRRPFKVRIPPPVVAPRP